MGEALLSALDVVLGASFFAIGVIMLAVIVLLILVVAGVFDDDRLDL